MKITVKKSVLLPKLAQLAKIADGKVIPILDDILIHAHVDGISLMSSDSHTFIQTSIHGAEVIREGSATIPADKLFKIVGKMGSSITIDAKNKKATVKSGESEYKLAGQEVEEFPEMPLPIGLPIRIKGEYFKSMITRTRFAVSTNENVPVLQGIRFVGRGSQLTATACDRHRLSKVSFELQGGSIDALGIVKGESFKELLGIIDDDAMVEIIFGTNRMFITVSDYMIALRVLDGSYPDTEKIIPREFKTKITVNREEFQEALERALVIVLDDKINVLRMEASGELQITSESSGNKALETVKHTRVGDQITVSFNGKYVVEALKAIKTTDVTLCLNGVMDPIIIQDGSTDIQLVLPYRTR